MGESSSAHSFEALGLQPELVAALQQSGHERPTPVQEAVIPAVIAGRDVKARAETGSGKTLAFGAPLLHQLATRPREPSRRGNPVAVLVLVPTRELAIQIGEVLTSLSTALAVRPKVLAVYGGVSVNPQMMAMRGGADILVATPGRLLDLQRQNAVELGELRSLVLDEADRMLGLGFQDELQQIVALLPAQRQNLLFSATYPAALEPLTRGLLASALVPPLEVDLPPVDTVALIEQHVYVVEAARKHVLLAKLIQQRDLEQVLVFVNMKKMADRVAERLNRAGVTAHVFHADRSHAERQRVLGEFRAKRLRVLVATDLAARGIDIEDLPTVINFELPRSPNDYTHRIGRTGRAGNPGLALSLICSDEYHHFGVIEKRLKRRFPREQWPGFELPAENDPS